MPAALLTAILGGCAAGVGTPAGAPVPDPGGTAAELQRATLPQGPQQVGFAWTLDEAGSRLRGRGVARLEAPERIRLDLFGPRGETYLAAALVGDEFRVPQALPDAVALPSPALLWGAVGVVRPPADAALVSATATERDLVVRYETPGGEILEYQATREPLRLTRVSRAGRSGVRETLQLSWDGDGSLQSTRYRDLDAFRELALSVEAMTPVTAFPPEIWSPDAAAR